MCDGKHVSGGLIAFCLPTVKCCSSSTADRDAALHRLD